MKTRKKRLITLVLGLAFLFTLLLLRFYILQVVEEKKWSSFAKRQHFFSVEEPFVRGTFYSNGTVKRGGLEESLPLVFDLLKYHLHVDPVAIPDLLREEASDTLIDLLAVLPEEQPHFRKQFTHRSRSRRLQMWLTYEEKERVLNWWQPFAKKNKIPQNTLFFISDYHRCYPFGHLMGQLLHSVQSRKDAVTKQAIPTGGLELSCNRYLQGTLGKRMLMRSPRHSFEMGQVIKEPEDGADIYLTINHNLQAIVEEELELGVKNCGAKGGWAVMIQPQTGEVLALAQYPFFYPGDYQTYFNDPDLEEMTRAKAITDAHEPGSVMKPITLAIALSANEELERRGEEPLFDPEEKTDTSNPKFKGRKPLRDTRLHLFTNMDMALQKSSNIYLARLVEKIIARLGDEWYREKLLSFGFSQKTGIELPAETFGLVPRIGVCHPNGALEWSQSTPYSLAMGHNILTNSMQLVAAYSALVNGGILIQPTCIRKIVKNDVVIEDPFERKKERVRILSEEIAARVVQSMKYVTSGKRADVLGYTEVGKSGSAHKVIPGGYSKDKFISSFIGVTPAEDPAFVLLVTMEDPAYGKAQGIGSNHMGGVCAAPVFRLIAKRALLYMGVPPDDPHGYPSLDPRYDKEKAYWIPETRLLQEKYEKWNHSQP